MISPAAIFAPAPLAPAPLLADLLGLLLLTRP